MTLEPRGHLDPSKPRKSNELQYQTSTMTVREAVTPVNFRECDVEGAWVVGLDRRTDDRGYFARVWCPEELQARGLNPALPQVNTALSLRSGTLRGMHFQVPPHAEVKIARCLRGAAFDVVLDLRPTSPTFRRWYGLTLTPDSGEMLYIPEGCAHGYLTLADDTELLYFTSKPYAAEAARGVRYDDPAFDIRWPAPIRIVSDADRSWQDAPSS